MHYTAAGILNIKPYNYKHHLNNLLLLFIETFAREIFTIFTNGGLVHGSLCREFFSKLSFAKVYLAKSF